MKNKLIPRCLSGTYVNTGNSPDLMDKNWNEVDWAGMSDEDLDKFFDLHPEGIATPQNNLDPEDAFNTAKTWLTDYWLPGRLQAGKNKLLLEYDEFSNKSLEELRHSPEASNLYRDNLSYNWKNKDVFDASKLGSRKVRGFYKRLTKDNPEISDFDLMTKLSFFAKNNIHSKKRRNNVLSQLASSENALIDLADTIPYKNEVLNAIKSRMSDYETKINNGINTIKEAKLIDVGSDENNLHSLRAFAKRYFEMHPNVFACTEPGSPYVYYSGRHDERKPDRKLTNILTHELNHLGLLHYEPNSTVDDGGTYLHQYREIGSRIREFLKYMKLDPSVPVTEEDLNNWRTNSDINNNFDLFNLFTNDELLRYFNDWVKNTTNGTSENNPFVARKGTKLITKALEGWLSRVDESLYYYNLEAAPVSVKLSKHKQSTNQKVSDKDETVSKGNQVATTVLNGLGNSWNSFWSLPVGYISDMDQVPGGYGTGKIFYDLTPRKEMATAVGAASTVPLLIAGAAEYGLPAAIGGLAGGIVLGSIGDKVGRSFTRNLGGNENALEMGGNLLGFAASGLGGYKGGQFGKFNEGLFPYVSKRKTWYAPFEYTLAHSGPGKRTIELAMRAGPNALPGSRIKSLLMTRSNLSNATKYIITRNKKYVNKWGYNPLSGLNESYNGSIQGLYDNILGIYDWNSRGSVDMIDAFLYGKPLPFKKSSDLGRFARYVKEHYPDKDVQVYELNLPYEGLPLNSTENIIIDGKLVSSEGSGKQTFRYRNGENTEYIDVGGHLIELGTQNGIPVFRGWDIWKFNPSDFKTRWYDLRSLPYSKWADFGLNTVNEAGTPIITKTQWGTYE